MWGLLTSRSNEMMHECRYASYVSVSSTWSSSLKWTDGRGIYYATVRYGTVLPLGGEGMLVCMRACTCAGLGGAMLGGAVLGGAVLGGAVRCLCGAGFIVGV